MGRWGGFVVVVFASLAMSSSVAAAADLDCADFGTSEAASRVDASEHRLDRDRDGRACEALPSSKSWGAVGGFVAGAVAVAGVSGRTRREWDGARVATVVAGGAAGAVAGWLAGLSALVLPRQTPPLVFAVAGALVAAGLAWMYDLTRPART